MFGGAIVAIVTPFRNGKVDEEALRKLIEEQIAAGTDGIAPCGTTGESTTLSHEEHDRVIEITIDAVRKRVPGHCRDRIQQHGGGASPDAARLGSGGRCRPDGLSLLQPSDPGGALSALPDDCGRSSDPDHHLQHRRAARG